MKACLKVLCRLHKTGSPAWTISTGLFCSHYWVRLLTGKPVTTQQSSLNNIHRTVLFSLLSQTDRDPRVTTQHKESTASPSPPLPQNVCMPETTQSVCKSRRLVHAGWLTPLCLSQHFVQLCSVHRWQYVWSPTPLCLSHHLLVCVQCTAGNTSDHLHLCVCPTICWSVFSVLHSSWWLTPLCLSHHLLVCVQCTAGNTSDHLHLCVCPTICWSVCSAPLAILLITYTFVFVPTFVQLFPVHSLVAGNTPGVTTTLTLNLLMNCTIMSQSI